MDATTAACRTDRLSSVRKPLRSMLLHLSRDSALQAAVHDAKAVCVKVAVL